MPLEAAELGVTATVAVAAAPPASMIASSLPTLIPAMGYARELCEWLAMHGVQVANLDTRRANCDVVSNDPDRKSGCAMPTDVACAKTTPGALRRALREREDTLHHAHLYMPVIHAEWFFSEDALLELYLALRCSVATGAPAVVPIIDHRLLDLVSDDPARVEATLRGPPSAAAVVGGGGLDCLEAFDSPFWRLLQRGARHSTAEAPAGSRVCGLLAQAAVNAMELVPWLCETCYFLGTDRPPREAAAMAVNFLRELGTPPAPLSAAAGDALVCVFEHQHRHLSQRKPNSGAMALLRHLPTSREELRVGVTHLSFANLFLSTTGTLALLPVLRMLPSLTALNLTGNGIENAVVHDVCDTLTYHPSIADLVLDDNEIAQAGASDVYFLCQANPRFVRVSLEQNPIASDVWMKRIEVQLAANRLRAAPLGGGGGGGDGENNRGGSCSTAASAAHARSAAGAALCSRNGGKSRLICGLRAAGHSLQHRSMCIVAKVAGDGAARRCSLTVLEEGRVVHSDELPLGESKDGAGEGEERNERQRREQVRSGLRAAVEEFVDVAAPANVFRLHRANDKYIHFLPEGPCAEQLQNASVLGVASDAIHTALVSAPCECVARLAFACVPSALHGSPPPPPHAAAAAAAASAAPLPENDFLLELSVRIAKEFPENEIPTTATECKKCFFVECSLLFLVQQQQPAAVNNREALTRLVLLSKSCPRFYRGDLTKSSGNITSELVTMLEKLAAVSVCAREGADGNSSAAVATIRAEHAAATAERAAEDKKKVAALLGRWGGGSVTS